MKNNLMIRVLASLGGVTLCCLGLGALAETFFHASVTAMLGHLLDAGTPLAVLLALASGAALCAFGVSCLMMLSPKRASKRKGFVIQKGENGTIGVAIKSIEGLVQTCIRQHEVVHRAEISVVERRDGIVILLDVQEAAGVNIPLAVGALQKQIRQYVNECTGVDVLEVRVMVENTEDTAATSPFAVKEPVVMTTAVTAAELQREAEVSEAAAGTTEEITEVPEMPEIPAQEPEQELAPVLDVPVLEEVPEEFPAVAEEPAEAVLQPVTVVLPEMPEILPEEDDRPLHQRIFGAEEQPVFVPMPPEMVIEPQPEEAPEEPAAVAEEALPESAEEAEASDELSPNAVMEVIEAIVEEEALAENEYAVEDMAYDEEVLAEEASLDGAEDEETIEKFTQED